MKPKIMTRFALKGNAEAEQMEWLNEAFITPLKEYGFELQYASSYGDKSGDTGFHMLRLTLDEEKYPNITEEQWEAIFAITDQDDDSQPHATHRYYMGDLWIWIPFYA